MNARTFDTRNPICPVCHRTGTIKPHKILTGLLICQHCRERLVVSCSGHYVRDPFTFKNLAIEQRLRRDSRPFARMCRDAHVAKPSLLLALLGSMVLLGAYLTAYPTTEPQLDLSFPSSLVEPPGKPEPKP